MLCACVVHVNNGKAADFVLRSRGEGGGELSCLWFVVSISEQLEMTLHKLLKVSY